MMSQQQVSRHRYSVYVNDVEVNNHFLTYDQAETLADSYRANGYDDVYVEEMISA
jgi:hypothetical protein